jgi:dienelactone hydrolase
MIRLLATVLLALVLAAAARADHHTRLVAHDPNPRGVVAAVGAVIWNPPADAERDLDPTPAHFVDVLGRAGYDIYRLERQRTGVREEVQGAEAIIDAAKALRARGYKRIVAAGQSAGGWLALRASATSREVIDAIVATAPAVHGPINNDRARADRARTEFARIMRHIDRVATMVFLFAGDEFDPGGRAKAVEASLSERGVPAMVLDAPPGWRGHGAGQSRAFARRFGPCIVAFVAPPRPPADLSCDRTPNAEIPFEFVLPTGWSPPRAANDNEPGAALIGAWVGSIENGDDVLLAIETIDQGQAKAIFARGKSRPAPTDQAYHQARRGVIEAGGGVLRIPADGNAPAIVAQRLDDRRLAVTITTANGQRSFRGELTRQRAAAR